MKKNMERNAREARDGREGLVRYRVLEKIAEAPGVVTLALALADAGSNDVLSVPRFTAGQFITVYFPETGTPEGKAYSISSAPGESALAITVRAIGEFSNRLCALRPGDVLDASLPCGYFSVADEDVCRPLVLMAAGIGITPFRSIIRDVMKNNPQRKIALFYSSRSVADMVFKNEFDALQKTSSNFAAHYFITRENSVVAPLIGRRMRAEDILSAGFENPEMLICGAISFVREIWQGLRAGGVPEDAIYTEAFFS